MTEELRTEAEVVAELAQSAAQPVEHGIEGGVVLTGAYPRDWDILQLDMVEYEARPRRPIGKYQLFEPASFLDYCDLQMPDEILAGDSLPTIWVHRDNLTVTAVFNDHQGGLPGWRDHLAVLRFMPTPEWVAWTSKDKLYYSAVEFAEFVDTWRHTISEPPTADLVELVRNFRAVKKATYGQEITDKDGSVRLEWSEEVAGAGRSGTIEVPDGFVLILAPFEGAPLVELKARFRCRVTDGKAYFGVILDQPDKVHRDAFDLVVDQIRAHAAFTVMHGAPATRT